ncbi:uncharacterized protein C8Q71DRAFT_158580 [Rhodofomes roseus]|uniref:Uncharacterized protein n=1 Tax=Rhodofomes roseus TaxID=34475 RepID=A0ABQ8KAV2_9APHY|nr:uncharacterized protein C8Q71DRAFT_158580 [Rhodofomes roseus]KAH9834065.1 hypothetical protein C8Q71DRAFT_158580 [Rhodofomes roseus]
MRKLAASPPTPAMPAFPPRRHFARIHRGAPSGRASPPTSSRPLPHAPRRITTPVGTDGSTRPLSSPRRRLDMHLCTGHVAVRCSVATTQERPPLRAHTRSEDVQCTYVPFRVLACPMSDLRYPTRHVRIPGPRRGTRLRRIARVRTARMQHAPSVGNGSVRGTSRRAMFSAAGRLGATRTARRGPWVTTSHRARRRHVARRSTSYVQYPSRQIANTYFQSFADGRHSGGCISDLYTVPAPRASTQACACNESPGARQGVDIREDEARSSKEGQGHAVSGEVCWQAGQDEDSGIQKGEARMRHARNGEGRLCAQGMKNGVTETRTCTHNTEARMRYARCRTSRHDMPTARTM